METRRRMHQGSFADRLYDPDMPSLADLVSRVGTVAGSVVLLEGTRGLPAPDRPLLVSMGRLLAQRLPGAVFRTGGATGSDDAFAEGVQAVDPRRIEYVLPWAGHRVGVRHADSAAHALEALGAVREREIADYTAEASPEYGRLARLYTDGHRTGALAAKTRYLLRDTLKVAGCPEQRLPAASAGIFFVNEDAPLSGGTGHTIRVCHYFKVPVYVQFQWRAWLAGGGRGRDNIDART